MKESDINHLEFVQSIINRMSNNSFLLKSWTVTISSAILALSIGVPKSPFSIIALFSSLAFWGLDAYYLRQERLFRCLYDEIRRSHFSKNNDKIEPFSLETDKCDSQVSGWFRTLWSKSVIGLHGVVLAVVIITISILFAY